MGQTIVLESFQEFAKRQFEDGGRQAAFLKVNTQIGLRSGDTTDLILFSNGARSNGTTHWDPPTDPVERLEARLAFLKAALKEETYRWQSFRAEVLNAGELAKRFSNLPGVSQSDIDQLEEGVVRIQWLRELIAEHEQELSALIEQSPFRKAALEQKETREALAAELAERHHQLMETVKGFSI
jgi:hypothetical protein